jgi:hypothetical protein
VPTRVHPNQMRNAATGRLTSHMARLNRLPGRSHFGPTQTHTDASRRHASRSFPSPETSAERIHLRYRDGPTPPTRVSQSGPLRDIRRAGRPALAALAPAAPSSRAGLDPTNPTSWRAGRRRPGGRQAPVLEAGGRKQIQMRAQASGVPSPEGRTRGTPRSGAMETL